MPRNESEAADGLISPPYTLERALLKGFHAQTTDGGTAPLAALDFAPDGGAYAQGRAVYLRRIQNRLNNAATSPRELFARKPALNNCGLLKKFPVFVGRRFLSQNSQPSNRRLENLTASIITKHYIATITNS